MRAMWSLFLTGLLHLGLRADQQMLVGDLLNETSLDQAIAGCAVVFNFAALADLDKALATPIDTARVNVLGNVLVLDACRRHSVRRFMYASTVYVYSREGGFYRCSKLAAEQYVEEYQRAYGLDYTILRYGSLYGPRSDNRNGLFRIVQDAIQKGVIRYVGSPEAMREYIHVEDAARASVVALGADFCNQSVILTGQEPMRVSDLLKMLAEIFGEGASSGICRGRASRPLCAHALCIPAQARSQICATNARGPGSRITSTDRQHSGNKN